MKAPNFLRGVWTFGGETLDVGVEGSPWDVANPSKAFAEQLHSFEWLGDLCSLGPSGLEKARWLFAEWTKEFGDWNTFSWRADLTARRVCAILYEGADLLEFEGNQPLLNTLSRQARHLVTSGPLIRDPNASAQAAIAEALTALAFDEERPRLAVALDGVQDAYSDIILSDGGHAKRSPNALLQRLQDITALDEALLRAGQEAPPWLAELGQAMAKMAHFFHAPDDRFYPLHGEGRDATSPWRSLLSGYDAPSSFAYSIKSGYQKLSKGALDLFVDASGAGQKQHTVGAHASAFAFQLFEADKPLFGPCGGHSDLAIGYREALRRSAAHCVLALEETSSARFLRDGPRGGLLGPADLTAKRFEHADGGVHLELQHAGWRADYGLLYRRRLELDDQGDVFSGEDALFAPLDWTENTRHDPKSYSIRFHAAPSVQVDSHGR